MDAHFFNLLGLLPMLLESFQEVFDFDYLKLFSICFLLAILASGPTFRSEIYCELILR